MVEESAIKRVELNVEGPEDLNLGNELKIKLEDELSKEAEIV
jgi:hypothetical protein